MAHDAAYAPSASAHDRALNTLRCLDDPHDPISDGTPRCPVVPNDLALTLSGAP